MRLLALTASVLILAGCASSADPSKTASAGDGAATTGVSPSTGSGTSSPAPASTWLSPLTAPPAGVVGQAPILLSVAGPVGEATAGVGRRWVEVVAYRDGSAVRIEGGTADPWASAQARRIVDDGAPVVESMTVGYLSVDPADLYNAIDGLPAGGGEAVGMPAVSDTTNTEVVVHGQDGIVVAEWDVDALGLEHDSTGTLDAALTTEQAAAREALSNLGRLVDDAFVAVAEEPADRLEVWAPYDITDGEVHWPGPPITEVVGDEGCGVIEGPDAETIRAHLAGGDTITDEPGLVVLALLAPQEEACIVRQ